MKEKTYSLSQVQSVMNKEGIGNSSTRYVLESLEKLQSKAAEVVDLTGPVHCEIKKMPTWGDGVRVTPSSTNNVTFDYKGERCQLHFLSNGNLAVSRESNKNSYLEINKDQVLELLMSKF